MGPVILSKFLYRGTFWGTVFTAIGFWPPRGLKNQTPKNRTPKNHTPKNCVLNKKTAPSTSSQLL